MDTPRPSPVLLLQSLPSHPFQGPSLLLSSASQLPGSAILPACLLWRRERFMKRRRGRGSRGEAALLAPCRADVLLHLGPCIRAVGLSLLSCEPQGPGCVVFSARFPSSGCCQLSTNNNKPGNQVCRRGFQSLGSFLDLFLCVCVQTREHMMVSSGSRLGLSGALAIPP